MMFDRAIPILAQHYRVVAMDVPGYGQSDKPPRKMEMPDYADAVARLLDALGIERADIVGHHTGGAVAVDFAVSHPERVAKLIICGVPYWEAGEREQMAKEHAPAFVPKEDGSHLTYHWERSKRTSPNAGVDLWQRRMLQILMAGEYYSSGYEALFRYDLASRLPLLKCPTLIMCGDLDPLHKASKPALALIPRAKEMNIHGTGGLIVDEKTEEYTRIVLEFLPDPAI